MRLVLEIDRTPDGRLEGRLRTDTADVWRRFSGVLELLKVLEEHTSISARSTVHTIDDGRDPS
ncbi:MAG: hypothetical protein ABSH30_13775 [Acidimicrobiales bacterium]|jgi:hypothetical protein